MSKAFILPYGKNLIDEVVLHLTSDGNDYSGNLIIFPGKRPAHFLRKALAERTGTAFIPPHIASMDGFIDDFYRNSMGRTERMVEAVDAVAILHEIYLASGHRIAAESFDLLDAFFPLGLKLFSELEEVAIAMPTDNSVRSTLGSVFVGNELSLWAIYQEFYRLVRDASMTTRAMKYAWVASGLTEQHLSGYSSIVAAGFFALTHAEEMIFRTLAGGRTTFLFQEGHGLQAQLQRLSLQAELQPGVNRKPSFHSYRSPDQHGQVFGLTGRLQEQCNTQGNLNERTVVVLPSADALWPVVQQTIPIIPREQFNISLGYPVTRTPVHGFLINLMQVMTSMHEGMFHAPEYVTFMLHPYTKNIMLDGRSDITRILVHTIEEHFAGRKSGTYFSLNEVEDDVNLFAAVLKRFAGTEGELTPQRLQEHLRTIHRMTIEMLRETRDVQDAARRCIQILTYIDDQSTANRHPLFRPYVGTIIESLDVLAKSLLGHHRFVDPSGYYALIRGILEQAEVPFPGTPLRGMQILGFLETRNLQFDTVYMLDVNDDVLPGGLGRRTLIPRTVRETLGLPTSREKSAIAAYYFDVLIGSARDVHLFYTENGKREKSRFIEQLFWEREQSAGKLMDEEEVLSIGYGVRLGNTTPGSIPKSQEHVEYLKRFVFTATALDAYLQCPLKFYYGHVLNIEEVEEVGGEIEAKDIGNLIHAVLRTFFQPIVNRPLSVVDLDETRLLQVIDEHFNEQFGEHRLGARRMVRLQVQKQLQRFLAAYQKRVIEQEPVTIVDLERQIREVRKGGFSFRGRLDRVERRGSSVVILDYKTGSNENRLRINFKKLDPADRTTWAEAIGSLQLPIYVLLYSVQTGTAPAALSPAYLFLGKNDMGPKIEMKLFEDDVLRTTQQAILENIIFSLLDEIIDSSMPFMPTDDFEANCPTCSFTNFCGTQWAEGSRTKGS